MMMQIWIMTRKDYGGQGMNSICFRTTYLLPSFRWDAMSIRNHYCPIDAAYFSFDIRILRLVMVRILVMVSATQTLHRIQLSLHPPSLRRSCPPLLRFSIILLT